LEPKRGKSQNMKERGGGCPPLKEKSESVGGEQKKEIGVISDGEPGKSTGESEKKRQSSSYSRRGGERRWPPTKEKSGREDAFSEAVDH